MFDVSIYSTFGKLFGQRLCRVLFQLIANEDNNISYMSASLLFDIYMKEQNIESKIKIHSFLEDNYAYCSKMWQRATMTDEDLLLGKMLAKHSNKSRNCASFLDTMTTYCMRNDAPYRSFQIEAYHSGECT